MFLTRCDQDFYIAFPLIYLPLFMVCVYIHTRYFSKCLEKSSLGLSLEINDQNRDYRLKSLNTAVNVEILFEDI